MPLAGLDEAGCGALMGDLVAAAVVLPDDDDDVCKDVADSKALPARRRAALSARLLESPAVRVGVGSVTPEEIDARGMAWARRAVFHRALDALGGPPPTRLVVDGTLFEPYRDIPYTCMPKADATVAAVSAASIVAKVERDARVARLCDQHPDLARTYAWPKNKGYPTRAHLDALAAHGPSEWHRQSFRPVAAAAADNTPLAAS